MQPGYYPLASGSKGNCTLFVSGECKLLIDAGISGRAIQEHLQRLGLELSDIDAILVTHEHGDHIQGLKVLALRKRIPVFANSGTAEGIIQSLRDCPQFTIFSTGETFAFRDLFIHPYSIQHDTLDPVGFTLQYGGIKVGFCTDLGFVTTLVRQRLQGCDYLFVEANHEPGMVHACNRPMTYKQRVLGRTGHLSNAAAGELLNDVWHPGLKHVHLAHLSSECNSPQKALEVVRESLGERGRELPLSIAYQDRASRPVLFAGELAHDRDQGRELVNEAV
ncbi:MAG: MBL fold metallo-hydrolase [Chlamydiia bacterium]|nr:MBL fold metallo-hydrolase [Chlamydiia bacterium]